MKDHPGILDYMDLDHLQRLQDQFSELTGCGAILLDDAGTRVTHQSRPLCFCKKMLSNEYEAGICEDFMRVLCNATRRRERAVTMNCLHSGLVVAAAPILLDHHFLGNWIMGMAHVGDPIDDLLFKTTKKLGLGKWDLHHLIAMIPPVSILEFEYNYRLLQDLAGLVVPLGASVTPARIYVDFGAQDDAATRLYTKRPAYA